MTQMTGTVPVLVQARLGSERLPGKVVADLEGRPLLAWLLDRLRTSRTASEIVVLTTTDAADDKVAELAETCGSGVVRGHPTDVLRRYCDAVTARGDSAFVRVSGDSPLLDGATVDTVVTDFLKGGAELVANHRGGDWPYGTAVEALSADCLTRLGQLSHDARHREHVTVYAYEHEDEFAIRDVPAPPAITAPGLRLAVDTAEDLARVRAICAHFAPRRDMSLAEIVAAQRVGALT
jgi:spore coat polysaccharide biosynthesis protein SpsF